MRTDHAERHIAASPKVVYCALTDRDMIQNWLPPQGARGQVDLFEPWPGGRFVMTLIFDQAGSGKTSDDTDAVAGEFLELVPDRLVRQRFTFQSDDPAFAGVMVMSWAITPMQTGTTLTVTAENVPAGIGAEDHRAAMASSLENLARLVE
ncbi:SRPBCC domain-containing protein [Paracoccus laeviglucosivorans]|uniref:Uncharacterized conserved protein YndB, AHSA1/START domain n=1 Tax=Paracoccus laeviglucosivorans TaxID=1197861 RepID=A0A521EFP0_9RHOB|nr:SRPBCC domain-containing protein [Paracoccus laeviglucosivorans]SMO82756.1 Uncharacterized conserved protein YndB, AHSA1/START domain [Paracoccus laeviglucosivorans]